MSKYCSSFKNYCKEVTSEELEKDENYLIMQAVESGDSTILENRYKYEFTALSQKVNVVN